MPAESKPKSKGGRPRINWTQLEPVAIELAEEGKTNTQICQALGVSTESLQRHRTDPTFAAFAESLMRARARSLEEFSKKTIATCQDKLEQFLEKLKPDDVESAACVALVATRLSALITAAGNRFQNVQKVESKGSVAVSVPRLPEISPDLEARLGNAIQREILGDSEVDGSKKKGGEA